MTPTAPKKQRRVQYLSNRNLLEEIAKSKNNYSAYLDDHHKTYDAIIATEPAELDSKGKETKPAQSPLDALSALKQDVWVKSHQDRLERSQNAFKQAFTEHVAKGIATTPAQHDMAADETALHSLAIGECDHLHPIIRVMTWAHIPLAPERTARAREKNKTHSRVCFPPFQHWELGPDGWHCVGKSHWQGGLHNGHFSNDHGRMTDELGKMIWMLIERYSTRGSWRGYSYRDEMVSEALESLMANALQFDESRTENPFAYYTTCAANCFRRVWRQEERHQIIRDDLLVMAGAAPSMTRQIANELAKYDPVKLPAKRGRKPKAK